MTTNHRFHTCGQHALGAGAELARLVDRGLPGAFIHIDDPDGTVTFHTAGVADVASRQRMTVDSHYRIGSTTKTFTAVVVLKLVADGDLTVGDRVSNWIDGLPAAHQSQLTVEHLLRMRSGLFDFVDHPTLLALDANLAPYTLDSVLDLALSGHPTFAPGERYAYCNTNYCLLQAIVEQTTGRPLGEEIAERILAPLHMRNTCYPAADDLSVPEPYIRGYDYDQATGGWRECTEVFCGLGDGAMISTASDLSRFFRALFDGRLLPEPLLATMQDFVARGGSRPERAYGLGLIADPLPCRTVWGHSGGGFGFDHAPFMDPATGRLVITMQNGTYGFRVTSIPRSRQPRITPELRCRAYGPPG